jgi:hypothetical protein
MTKDEKIQYLQNRLRDVTHKKDCLEVYADGLQRRIDLTGLTPKEEKKLWCLCQRRDWNKLERYLTYILSPAAWMTSKQLEELEG